MSKIYYDKDADLSFVLGKTIAIVGYGNQGRAQALNMRDSGIEHIVIGSVRDESWTQANEDGFAVMPIAQAAAAADIVFILIPDEVAPAIYLEEIQPHLKIGAAVNFSSGYNITYGHIVPRSDLDVIMVAPRMIGEGVRETYLDGTGFPTFVVVHQDATGQAKGVALGLAKALGSTKAGAIEVTFDEETYLDLMSEQGVWPLIMNVMNEAFELFVERGFSLEAILTELYLSREPAIMLEKMAEVGIFKQLPMHSRTSQYGQLSRFAKVDRAPIRAFLEEQLESIQSGAFAREWAQVVADDFAVYDQLKEEAFHKAISLAEIQVKENLSGKG